jgi:hypothetical protein
MAAMPNTETLTGQGINALLARESAAWVILLLMLVLTAAWQFSVISLERQAMERARDSGQPALSGKVILQQEDGSDVHPAFVILPQRRARLRL